jgi:putative endonuclease
MYTVYVLFSKLHHKIYIGYTADLNQRLIAHNHPNNRAYTKRFQPWIVAYSEIAHSKTEALRREKQLKSAKGRAFIWNLINNS